MLGGPRGAGASVRARPARGPVAHPAGARGGGGVRGARRDRSMLDALGGHADRRACARRRPAVLAALADEGIPPSKVGEVMNGTGRCGSPSPTAASPTDPEPPDPYWAAYDARCARAGVESARPAAQRAGHPRHPYANAWPRANGQRAMSDTTDPAETNPNRHHPRSPRAVRRAAGRAGRSALGRLAGPARGSALDGTGRRDRQVARLPGGSLVEPGLWFRPFVVPSIARPPRGRRDVRALVRHG